MLTLSKTTMLAGNPVLTPNNNDGAEPIIGQPFNITWNGAGLPDKIDLAICQGPSTACNVIGDIIIGAPNTNLYTWSVPCSQSPTESNAGYGILLIDDATGQYQYSTQFGFQADTTGACSGSSSSSSSSSSSAPSSHTGSKTGHGGSSFTTSPSSAAPTQSGSVPSGGSGGSLNTTSTTYVMPTGKSAGSTPTPTYTPVPGAATAVARSVGLLAAAALAAAAFLV
jgi:hypothetical protein